MTGGGRQNVFQNTPVFCYEMGAILVLPFLNIIFIKNVRAVGIRKFQA